MSSMFKKLKKFIDADPDAPKLGPVPLPEVEDTIVYSMVQQEKPSKPKWRDECMSDGEVMMRRPRKPSLIARSSTPAPKPVKAVVDVPPRPAAPKSTMMDCRIQSINLHWLLLPYDCRRSRGHLEFDITQRIDRIRLWPPRGSPRPLTVEELNKPVADRTLTKMDIACNHLPWCVRIRREEGIRIVDVLDGIQKTYYRTLTDADRERIPPQRLPACHRAFKHRCRTALALPEVVEREGMRRVDMLEGKTMFLGLICPPPDQSQSQWILHMGKARDSSH
ncbi:hypothetical protein GLOTRDRAFT_139179 [Gloeophyllum trabeum ATCC 11539]|uniref:DUF6699 domain-containing protein n=1 Tax=Gloeophyllum trabeum (strain ATCC 11539 / FP-39264 / Madison 617) TaxID=670483 RepID=S7Q3R2_GLOTA|nr:uncharacterized protein GLOTRDRAFT_139179 [Gloeophyllum trabeum ATCC 11539]EPQ54641.1 hypothetical protein GLOTRDRAFT_139179 [Gloeophyllum trabeum ATCC 11539]